VSLDKALANAKIEGFTHYDIYCKETDKSAKGKIGNPAEVWKE
jgi:hypothetical protein